MRNSTRRLIIAVVSAFCLSVAAGTASAYADPSGSQNWGPLNSFYKHKERVSGSGSVHIDGSTYIRTDYTLVDPLADGNTVYGRVTYYYWKICSVTDTAPSWCVGSTYSTDEISNTTSQFTLQDTLDTKASQVRAEIEVCAQMGWPVPDSCSNTAIITMSY